MQGRKGAIGQREEKRFTSLFAMSTRTRSEQKRRVAACLRVCVCAFVAPDSRSAPILPCNWPERLLRIKFPPDTYRDLHTPTRHPQHLTNPYQTPTETYKHLPDTCHALQPRRASTRC